MAALQLLQDELLTDRQQGRGQRRSAQRGL